MSNLSEEFRQALKAGCRIKCYTCHGPLLAREQSKNSAIDLYCGHCDFVQQSFFARSTADYREMLNLIDRR